MEPDMSDQSPLKTTFQSEGQTVSVEFAPATIRNIDRGLEAGVEVFVRMYCEDLVDAGRQLHLRVNQQPTLHRVPKGGRQATNEGRPCFEYRFRLASGESPQSIEPVWREDGDQALGHLNFRAFGADGDDPPDSRQFDRQSDDTARSVIGLAPQIHLLLMIVSVVIVFFGGAVLGHLWQPIIGLFIVAGLGVSLVYLLFYVAIPVRCPDCGQRAKCIMKSGPTSSDSYGGSGMTVRYECGSCGYDSRSH
jgi:hypothetical protein